MRFGTKVTITCVTVGVALAATVILLVRETPHDIPLFPVETAEKLSVDELAARFEPVGTLLLPTWMPDEVKLQEIYYVGEIGVLVYSDEDMVINTGEDLLDAKLCIQITPVRRSPTLEEFKNWSSVEVLEVGEFLAAIHEDCVPSPAWEERGMTPIIAYCYHDRFYYIIGGKKGETTREELIRILESMKPVGPETLRKS